MVVFQGVLLFLLVISVLYLAPVAVAEPLSGGFLRVEHASSKGSSYSYRSVENPHLWSGSILGSAYYAYDSQKASLFIRPQDGKFVYRVNIPERLKGLLPAKLEKVGEGVPIAGYDTTQWRLSVLGELCADIFTSTKAAEDLGLTFVDQNRINQGLREAFSKPKHTENKCDNFDVGAALGNIVGYALAIGGKDGDIGVLGIKKVASPPVEYIKARKTVFTIPLNDKARKELLLTTVSADERDQLEQLTAGASPKALIQILQARQK